MAQGYSVPHIHAYCLINFCLYTTFAVFTVIIYTPDERPAVLSRTVFCPSPATICCISFPVTSNTLISKIDSCADVIFVKLPAGLGYIPRPCCSLNFTETTGDK